MVVSLRLVALVPFLWVCAVLAGSVAAQSEAPVDLAKVRYGRLTLREKVGQLFVAWTLSAKEGQEDSRSALLEYVRDGWVGGVILSLGTTEEAADLVRELQDAAYRFGPPNLILAGDFEGGVSFRLAGATEMGNQMLVGATRQARLARAMGEVTGQEARALGIPWVFAPVLDVNSNPNNPIINVRSFGEDPVVVSRLGAAFVEGVQAAGALACGKHFPGHGDVSSDSHLELPTVPGDAERLRRVELAPFAAASAVGLGSIMTGHLAVPGLGEDPAVPATLSKRILVDVLRQELGFTGLVVTDALDMGGVKNNDLDPGEVAVRALLAGADVLLMPPDPKAAAEAVLEAVDSGRLSRARLGWAVMRMLRCKARLGLLGEDQAGPADDWRQRVNTPAGRALADDIAARGITVVRDDEDLLPLDREQEWLLVQLFDALHPQDRGPARGDALLASMRQLGFGKLKVVAVHADADPSVAKMAAQAIAGNKRVVLAMHVGVRSYAGKVGLPAVFDPVMDALAEVPTLASVSFGSPYLITERRIVSGEPLPYTYICAYASCPPTEVAVARLLSGKAGASGRLPVAIPGLAPAGAGLTVLPEGLPTIGDPELEGVSPKLAGEISELLQDAVAERIFPGAVCSVARNGKILCQVAEGRVSYDDEASPVAWGTLYDLASLTKVCATTPVVLALVEQGKLTLEDPVQRWLPEFVGVGKEQVTIRHLLAHSSGLPPYVRYFRSLSSKEAVLAAAMAEGLKTAPGAEVTYSDIGFMLLMAVAEAATQESFADLAQRLVFVPLEMSRATFAPTEASAVQAAPTERDGVTGLVKQGYVHDENAYAMGGVSGHAGLFATAEDVTRFGVAMMAGGRGRWSRPLVEEALRPQAAIGSRRGLGLDLLRPGWAGTTFGVGAFGHTGFTGTSLWCDPQSGVCVVLLTNRVHPTRENSRIGGVRAALHDLVMDRVER